VLALGLGSPTVAQVTVSENESLLFQAGGRGLQLRVGSERISGGGLQLRRVPQGLRGTLDGRPVDLRWDEEGNITGQASHASVDLLATRLSPQPGLSMEGWFGGDTAGLRLTPTGISGTVGRCSYSLSLAGNRYAGWRTCDTTRGPPVPVTLRIPARMLPLDASEEGALLALLLSGELLLPVPSPEESPGLGSAGTPSP
jgi:hypothetical protein